MKSAKFAFLGSRHAGTSVVRRTVSWAVAGYCGALRGAVV